MKRIRRKNKNRKIRIFFGIAVTAIVIFAGLNFVNDMMGGALFARETVINRVIGKNKSDSLIKPVAYTKDELDKKLYDLSLESESYKKIYENREKYPEKLLSAVCNNSEMVDFVLNYPGENEAKKSRFDNDELNTDYPLLFQWDKRWGYSSYGDSCIGLSGCAPTCMSMVVLSLTGNENATPDAVADYAQRAGYYLEGTGTSWSFMVEGASHYNIKGYEICLSENVVKSELQDNHPVICSMKSGDFTTEGHFIVLVKVSDGKIVVNDPNSRARSNALWDYDTLAGQIKNLWAFRAD